MRKFTSLLMMLLVLVGTAWGQDPITVTEIGSPIQSIEELDANTRFVMLHNVNRDTYVSQEGEQLMMRNSIEVGNNYEDIKGKLFAIDKNGDNYTIKSANDKHLYIWHGGSLAVNYDVDFKIAQIKADVPGIFYMQEVDNNVIADGNGMNSTFVGWNTTVPTGTTGNNQYEFIPVTFNKNFATITFSYKVDNEVKYTVNRKQVVGTELQDAPTFGYVTFEQPTKITVNADATFNIDCTLEATPFKYNASYSDIKQWYKLFINPGTKSAVYYDPAATYIDASKTAESITDDYILTYLWAIVGDPFNGFQVVNCAAGADKVLTSATPNNGNQTSTYPYMQDGNMKWKFAKSSVSGRDDCFCIAHPESGYLINRNGYSAKLAFWSTNDFGGGNSFYMEEALTTEQADFKAEILGFQEWVNAIGTEAGNIVEASAAELKAAIQAAHKAVADDTKDYDIHRAAMQAAVANLKTVQPDPNAYYRIVSSCTRDHRAGQLVYVKNNGDMHFAREQDNLATSAGYVFRFEDAGNGKFYMYNVERGVYMQTVGTASETKQAKAKPVTIANMGKENVVSIWPEGQNMMHAQDAYSKIVGWTEPNVEDGSAWKLEKYNIAAASHPLTFNATGWATLYLGYNAVIPEGVTAYAVSSQDASRAKLAEINDGTIPANCAVLLYGTPGATVEFKGSTAGAAAIEANMLEGTGIDTNVKANAYVLSKVDNGEVGFYKAALNQDDNTAFKNNAFKAYLPAGENQSRFLIFGFDGNETGIGNIEGNDAAANAVIYDLSGRRVQNATKGIFIVNGKKVIK